MAGRRFHPVRFTLDLHHSDALVVEPPQQTLVVLNAATGTELLITKAVNNMNGRTILLDQIHLAFVGAYVILILHIRLYLNVGISVVLIQIQNPKCIFNSVYA